MHKIQEKEFTLEDFSTEHLSQQSLDALEDVLITLNRCRVWYISKDDKRVGMHTEMSDECYAKYKKDLWWQMIQLLPSSYNQIRNVMMNYEVLANIYKSRKNHKLDEWREFCKWIETLPYSELIIGFKEYDTVEYGKAHPEFVDKVNKIATEGMKFSKTFTNIEPNNKVCVVKGDQL